MTTLIILTDTLGLVFGWRMLKRAGPFDSSWKSVLKDVSGIVYVGLALGVACFVAAWTFLSGYSCVFGVMRLGCHVLFCVSIPLLMATSLRYWTWKKSLTISLLVFGLAVESLYIYARRVEPYRLQVTRYEIQSDRLLGLTSPIKVMLLADLQTDVMGDYEARVFQTIADEDPDLLLLAGDYLQCESDSYHDLRVRLQELFKGLPHLPPLGMFAVQGDVDRAEISLAGTGARILVDTVVPIPEEPLQIVGLSQINTRRDLSGNLSASVDSFDGFSIVMGHAPEFALPFIEGRESKDVLLVAGHTHGGQIVIPGFGPPITLSRVPRYIAAGGHFYFGDAHLIVSRGVGLERGHAPRIRLFCPPQLVVITLKAPGP